MPRAVLKQGVIYPVEPLPTDWNDGTELLVEKSALPGTDRANNPTDAWMDKVEGLAAAISPGDDERLMETVAALRRQDREVAQRKAGQGR